MPKAEFFVDQVSIEDGFVFVNGVVNRGSVRVGMVFSAIQNDPNPKSQRAPAQILVAGITSYRRERELLHSRNDGILKVSGEGANLLKEGDVLHE